MKAKVIRNQDGGYYDIFTGKRATLLIAEHAVYGDTEGWLDFNDEQEACKFFGLVKASESITPFSLIRSTEIPENCLVPYTLQSSCPMGVMTRTAYWCGDIFASDKHFRIDFLVKHNDHPELDKWIYTYIDRLTTITNPETGEPVNEYEFFYGMLEQGMPFFEVIAYGLQKADLDGTINKRLYYEH